MINLILGVFWLFLPAGLANMSPVLFKWLPFLDIPVDFNKKYKGKRIFGDHKTWRGLVVGILVAILIVYIQKQLAPTIDFALIDYTTVNIALLGFLLGGGALAGDLVESFIKRQVGIKPGKQWSPWDQLDWIIGAIILTSIIVPLTAKEIIIAIILFGLLHPLMNILGYTLKIQKNRF
jgi:CDP-2,3-bis-(O-geranylgeranyl)-sn-glycerol synthase